jgi:TDG/mug DNA glycosylase family protein
VARVAKGTRPQERPRPSREELEAAYGKGVRAVVGPDLRVLFCGINPGLYTAAIGHHFGRPGNRFWTALHRSGFTAEQISPYDERELLYLGIGITNVVNKATRVAEEVSREDLEAGGAALVRTIRRYRPKVLAVLGLGAYRSAFGRPKAVIGPQPERIAGTRVWVLPNPSGRTASYQMDALEKLFRSVREDAGLPDLSRSRPPARRSR